MPQAPKKTLVFIATTPFAVNAFLKNHILTLSANFDIKIFVNKNAYQIDKELAEKIDIVNINIARNISIFKDIYVLFYLLIYFTKLAPFSVHTITPKAGLLGIMAAWAARVKNRNHTFTGQVWETKTGKSRFFLRALDCLVVILSTQVFTDSRSQLLFLRKEGVVPIGKGKILGPGSIAGVNLNKFKSDHEFRVSMRRKLDVGENEFIFLFVGRLTKEKGIYELLRSFEMMQKEEKDSWLWIVGPDEESLQKNLQIEFKEKLDKIKWFGATDEPESYMLAADILVLPSYREGFGSVIIEAAACGLPALGTRVNGIVDAIIDNQTGYIVPPRNISALYNAMMGCLRNRGHVVMMGNQAKARVNNIFCSKGVTKEWDKYYQELI